MRKFTLKQADQIRKYAASRDFLDTFRQSLSNEILANYFGCSVSLIASILSRQTYGSPVDIEVDSDVMDGVIDLNEVFENLRKKI